MDSQGTSRPGLTKKQQGDVQAKLASQLVTALMQAQNKSGGGALVPLVKQAITPNKKEPDIELNTRICEMIEKHPDGPILAMKVMRYGLQKGTRLTQLLTLELLDAAMRMCDERFHQQVAKRDFIQLMLNVIDATRFYDSDKLSSMEVAVNNKILNLFRAWGEFFVHDPLLRIFPETLKQLRKQGAEFPYREGDHLNKRQKKQMLRLEYKTQKTWTGDVVPMSVDTSRIAVDGVRGDIPDVSGGLGGGGVVKQALSSASSLLTKLGRGDGNKYDHVGETSQVEGVFMRAPAPLPMRDQEGDSGAGTSAAPEARAENSPEPSGKETRVLWDLDSSVLKELSIVYRQAALLKQELDKYENGTAQVVITGDNGLKEDVAKVRQMIPYVNLVKKDARSQQTKKELDKLVMEITKQGQRYDDMVALQTGKGMMGPMMPNPEQLARAHMAQQDGGPSQPAAPPFLLSQPPTSSYPVNTVMGHAPGMGAAHGPPAPVGASPVDRGVHGHSPGYQGGMQTGHRYIDTPQAAAMAGAVHAHSPGYAAPPAVPAAASAGQQASVAAAGHAPGYGAPPPQQAMTAQMPMLNSVNVVQGHSPGFGGPPMAQAAPPPYDDGDDDDEPPPLPPSGGPPVTTTSALPTQAVDVQLAQMAIHARQEATLDID